MTTSNKELLDDIKEFAKSETPSVYHNKIEAFVILKTFDTNFINKLRQICVKHGK